MGRITRLRMECTKCGNPLVKYPSEHTYCQSKEHEHYACPNSCGAPACVEVKLDPDEDGVEFTSDPDITVDGVLKVTPHAHPLN